MIIPPKLHKLQEKKRIKLLFLSLLKRTEPRKVRSLAPGFKLINLWGKMKILIFSFIIQHGENMEQLLELINMLKNHP